MLKHCRPDNLARGHLSLLHRVYQKLYFQFMLITYIKLTNHLCCIITFKMDKMSAIKTVSYRFSSEFQNLLQQIDRYFASNGSASFTSSHSSASFTSSHSSASFTSSHSSASFTSSHTDLTSSCPWSTVSLFYPTANILKISSTHATWTSWRPIPNIGNKRPGSSFPNKTNGTYGLIYGYGIYIT